MFNFDTYFSEMFGFWRAKTGGAGTGGGLHCLLELLSGSFHLLKFHPNWQDCMYPPDTVAHKGHAANKKVAANKKKLLQIKKKMLQIKNSCCK